MNEYESTYLFLFVIPLELIYFYYIFHIHNVYLRTISFIPLLLVLLILPSYQYIDVERNRPIRYIMNSILMNATPRFVIFLFLIDSTYRNKLLSLNSFRIFIYDHYCHVRDHYMIHKARWT